MMVQHAMCEMFAQIHWSGEGSIITVFSVSRLPCHGLHHCSVRCNPSTRGRHGCSSSGGSSWAGAGQHVQVGTAENGALLGNLGEVASGDD